MKQETKRIVTIAILSALGTVLMLIEIPYPIFPWLFFDLSDVVVLVVFMAFGWKEATLVGVLKALIHAFSKGTGLAPFYLGQITAFIASMSYVLGMYVASHKFHLNRFISALISVLVMTMILVFMNYLFITPSWIFGSFATVADLGNIDFSEALGVNFNVSYLTTILIIYVPFNLFKGVIILGVFTAIYKSISTIFTNN